MFAHLEISAFFLTDRLFHSVNLSAGQKVSAADLFWFDAQCYSRFPGKRFLKFLLLSVSQCNLVRVCKKNLFGFLFSDNDQFISNLFHHNLFFVQGHGIDCVIMSIRCLVQPVMKSQTQGIPCDKLFSRSEFKVKDGVKF